ncbi:MAG TPA: DNA polymerase ligase N-terminal domain-containing protein [Anaerolineales bacterium]|nr:DNA polymerase ligase N-terminal domain-containing protein [Anaerolineales bacterium]
MPGSDAKLNDYRKKRNFQRTREPSGEESWPAANEQPVFVIQKHDASTLHYDFRLEVDGVLKSWAVPKGPSTNPADKRLAVPTEDHPLGYADFEGLIPEGEYGAGAVIVWDRGNYRNLRAEKEADAASMGESLAEGKVEVWLEGEKLQGGYALIRTSADPKDEKWLLIKMDDDQADARRKPTSTQPTSVLSGRTLAEVQEKETE